MLKNPKVVIVEESGKFDIPTDSLVQKILRDEMSRSTILTVAKNISTITASTKVMILKNGKLHKYERPQDIDQAEIYEC